MNKRKDNFRYEEMPADEMSGMCNRIIRSVKEFKPFFQDRFAKVGDDCILETPNEKIQLAISIPKLMEICRRIDQRAFYYKNVRLILTIW